MLHPVPDSECRARLLRVVVLQRRLIWALCALPPGAVVDLAWLQEIWGDVGAEWIGRFWTNGGRGDWIQRIAMASAADKQTIRELGEEQLRFRELWGAVPAVRMRQQRWETEPFRSLHKLLISFYAPLFYDREGYEFGQNAFSKKDLIGGVPRSALKVCPYCDNYLQTPELDHFLPKNDFPFLSCHPDNLIPSCHDSNAGSHKGTTPPLDWDSADQAADWFHPRWRTAQGSFSVLIMETQDRNLAATVRPANPDLARRVTNFDNTFQLSKFWSEQIEDELQLVGSQVSDLLFEDGAVPTEDVVRSKLLHLGRLKKLEIGKRGLAICHHALYQFAADTPAVVSEITAGCRRDSQGRQRSAG